jgi:hypothetical protein
MSRLKEWFDTWILAKDEPKAGKFTYTAPGNTIEIVVKFKATADEKRVKAMLSAAFNDFNDDDVGFGLTE